MFFITLTIISGILAGVSLYAGSYYKKNNDSELATAFRSIAVIACLGWLAVLIFNSLYTQDPGQASVVRSFTGAVKGVNYSTGIQVKSPLSSRIVYDIRNNSLSYVGANDGGFTNGDINGPQVTFQDADGVTGNIDLTVRYSIRGDAVQKIYEEFKTQEEFVNATLANDARSQVREIAAGYHTLELFNSREKIKDVLVKKLQERWDKLGVDVEEVYLQEVRYSDEVKANFDAAQNARTQVETAKAEQERAKVEAETNKIKSKQLTKAVLMEKLIDAIRNGNGTYIIDTKNVSIGVK